MNTDKMREGQTEQGYQYYVNDSGEIVFHDGDGAILTQSDIAALASRAGGDEIKVPNEHGKNRYGLDMAYFRNVINRDLNRPLTDHVPSDFARMLARMARTACAEVLQEPEFSAGGDGEADARRYRRLRVLGCAPGYSDQLAAGTVIRFQGLDEYIDQDLRANPSRGEAASPPAAQSGGDGEAVGFLDNENLHHLIAGKPAKIYAVGNKPWGSQHFVYLHPPPPAAKVPEWMATISEKLKTQDNRITADPFFVVFQKTSIVVDEDYSYDRIVWVDDNGDEADEETKKQLDSMRSDIESTGYMEDEIELGDDDRQEWRRLAIKEVDQFVTACFTEAGAEAYLKRDGHNLNKPFIYVTSLYRNEEMKRLREGLLSTTPTPEGKR